MVTHIQHIHTQTHKHKIDLMTDSNKHWGFCVGCAFSISTICIPSLELPQPIQTAAILNRAMHTRLPTEGHYCVSWPQLSQQSSRHSRKKTAAFLWLFVQKIFFGFWKILIMCTEKYQLVECNITHSSSHNSRVFGSLPNNLPFIHSDTVNINWTIYTTISFTNVEFIAELLH